MVYFDNAATTNVSDKVVEAMLPYFTEKYGNSASLHSFGREAAEAVERSRQIVADTLGCSPEEIIFTSGSTESNNLSVKGAVEAIRSRLPEGVMPHLILSPIEHHCVLDSGRWMEETGQAEVTWLSVDSEGLISLEEVEKSLRDNTVLVSVMYINNEIGTIEPIEGIGKTVRHHRSCSLVAGCQLPVFHTDAVQALGYFDCQVDRLGVDLLSCSAHKFHGPKGVGFLYVRKGTPLARLQHGGSQENQRRAGTSNVPGIVGLGEALKEAVRGREARRSYVTDLRDKLIAGVLKIPDVVLSGPKDGRARAPHIASFLAAGVDGEALLLRLDKEGFAVSSGSACTSASLDPSHVLLATGVGEAQSHGSIRVSLSSYNTEEEVESFAPAFRKVVEEVRKMAPKI